MAPEQLLFVRHAETVANRERRWQGQRHDGEITPRGYRQIEAVARRLADLRGSVAALYTSPLRRALETAQAIGQALDLSPIVEPGFREIDFGQLDSLTSQEIRDRHPAFFAAWQRRDNLDLTWPGGERRLDFHRRVRAALERVLNRHDGSRVVIVAHGGTIWAGLCHLLHWSIEASVPPYFINCSLTRLRHDPLWGWRLLTLNEACHLEGLVDDLL